MNWVIYTLSDPRTREVRYVGKTQDGIIEDRLEHHITEAIRTQNTYKNRWLFSLISIGLHPVLEVIESGVGEGWEEAERRLIALYRSRGGRRLTNTTRGGEGVSNWGTPEIRSAFAYAKIMAMPPEIRNAIKKHHRKWRDSLTPEQRRDICIRGFWGTMTPEERSAAASRRELAKTPEERSRLAKARSAAKTPEERSDAVRRGCAGRTPEQRSESARKRSAAKTPEQRAASARKGVESMSFEQLQERSRRAHAALTPEQRRNRSLKLWATRRERYGPKGIPDHAAGPVGDAPAGGAGAPAGGTA